jgi:hypothetical protein
MTALDLLGLDIRSKRVADFLESRSLDVDLNVFIADGIEREKSFTIADQGIGVSCGLDMLVNCIHLYGEGVQDCRQYPGELPLNLCFGQSRPEVLAMLGTVSKSGGGRLNAQGEMIPKWDHFDCENYSIHLQFSPRDSLELVTVMNSEDVPA